MLGRGFEAFRAVAPVVVDDGIGGAAGHLLGADGSEEIVLLEGAEFCSFGLHPLL